MPDIHLRTEHTLGLAAARQRVEKIASDLKDRLAVDYHWVGNTVEFSRTGADGTILVEDSAVTINAKLGIMLAAFKGEVEKQLKGFLEENLK